MFRRRTTKGDIPGILHLLQIVRFGLLNDQKMTAIQQVVSKNFEKRRRFKLFEIKIHLLIMGIGHPRYFEGCPCHCLSQEH